MLRLLASAIGTTLAVTLAGRAGERFGPLGAALAMAFPLNAGPGYLLVIVHGADAAFIERAALVSLAGCGAVLLFTALYVRHVDGRGFRYGVIVSLAGWAALALPLAIVRPTWPAAVALIVVGAALARVFWRSPATASAPPATPPTWSFLIVRGVIVGATVSSVAALAGSLGPVFAGLAFAFPLILLSSAIVLELGYGRGLALASLAAVPRTLWVYGVFCVVLYVTVHPVGPLGAWCAAAGAAVVTAVVTARVALSAPSR